MSVLSRTRTPRTQKQVDIPLPRTSASDAPSTPSGGIPRLALLAAGVVAAAAVGTAVWTAVDDDPSPAAPGVNTPAVVPPGNGGADKDVLSERIARELQRDRARAGTFAD